MITQLEIDRNIVYGAIRKVCAAYWHASGYTSLECKYSIIPFSLSISLPSSNVRIKNR